MAGFQVGTSYLGGQNVLGGGEDGMNTTFNIFSRGELFPYVATIDTSGLSYFSRGEVYPAIYYYSSGSGLGLGSRTTIAIAIGIGL